MACTPPHLTTHTSEPAAEPGSDAESQPSSSQALATRSQQQQQQQNADTRLSLQPDHLSATQTASTAATGAGCSAKPSPDAGSGEDTADSEAGINSSGSSMSSQHRSGDKLQRNAAAAPEASCSRSQAANDKLQHNTTAASGSSFTGRGAAAGVHQPSSVAQQVDKHNQSEPSSVSQQTGSQHSKPSQAIQQLWQDQSGHQAAILQAIEHWACRLEMSAAGKASKPRARRHLSRRQRAHIRHAMEQQNQIDDAAGQPLCMSSSGRETASSVVGR